MVLSLAEGHTRKIQGGPYLNITCHPSPVRLDLSPAQVPLGGNSRYISIAQHIIAGDREAGRKVRVVGVAVAPLLALALAGVVIAAHAAALVRNAVLLAVPEVLRAVSLEEDVIAGDTEAGRKVRVVGVAVAPF